MTHLEMSFDLRRPSWVSDSGFDVTHMIAQCEWADRVGFDVLSFAEHHGTDDGYLPAPLIAASAVAARTASAWLRMFLPVPFYDPLRLAEDLAVLDRVSQGRIIPVLMAGYRDEEFAMFGRRRAERGPLTDEAFRVLREAWSGEPFDFRGRRVRVTPTPFSKAGPPIFAGAMTEAVARRRAPLADVLRGERSVVEAFRDERRRLGLSDPGPRPAYSPIVVGVSQDPDKMWETVGPHVIHHVARYREWIIAGAIDVMDVRFPPLETIDQVKSNSEFVVLHPDQCVELAAQLGDDGVIVFQPLCGGIDPDLAWSTLSTFEDRALPHIQVHRASRLTY